MKRILFAPLTILLIALVILPVIGAQESGHITLLAVSQDTQKGSTADLQLRLQEGAGGIYIETFPLTKIDTQLSTRFAQQVACEFIEEECKFKDFFYTIRSDATIIGGPSAGAALAVLTVSLLDDLEMNESVTITGTINVGGLIGPVGGVLGKIDAAKDQGITKVLIPKGSRYEKKPEHSYNERLTNTSAPFYTPINNSNSNEIDESEDSEDEDDKDEEIEYEIDLYVYGEEIGVEVIEVATLQEALFHVTGKIYEINDEAINPEPWYTETMQGVAQDLCGRMESYTEDITQKELFTNTTLQAQNATNQGMHYVAASTCFGGNIRAHFYDLNQSVHNHTFAQNYYEQLNTSLAMLENQTNQHELETITDLQTFLVVSERIAEAKDTLNEVAAHLSVNASNKTAYGLAYTTERYHSAVAWAEFFDNEGLPLNLDQHALEASCVRTLSQAQERYHYIQYLTEQELPHIVSYILRAETHYNNNEFALCLDVASRAKANIDIVLSLMGVKDEEELKSLVEERLKLVRQVLNKQQDAGLFPMLGYSYYEYAMFLVESDPYSALIYSHYALEFSHLDMYFEEQDKSYRIIFDIENALYFFFGLGVGLLLAGIGLLVTQKE